MKIRMVQRHTMYNRKLGRCIIDDAHECLRDETFRGERRLWSMSDVVGVQLFSFTFGFL